MDFAHIVAAIFLALTVLLYAGLVYCSLWLNASEKCKRCGAELEPHIDHRTRTERWLCPYCPDQE